MNLEIVKRILVILSKMIHVSNFIIGVKRRVKSFLKIRKVQPKNFVVFLTKQAVNLLLEG